jgi:hypothetical protein
VCGGRDFYIARTVNAIAGVQAWIYYRNVGNEVSASGGLLGSEGFSA